MTWLQCCLNGVRRPEEHPAVPVRPDELATAAASAVAAGATDLHLHPKADDGTDRMEPDTVADALAAVRAAVPGIPVGVTTGAWTTTSARRQALVTGWRVRPDHASVNWHEEDAEPLARELLDRGIDVEAGVWSGTEGLARFLVSPLRHEVRRILVETTEPDPVDAVASAERLVAALEHLDRQLLLHGEGPAAWPVLEAAVAWGLLTRVGLEDVLTLPDGSRAPDNAALVRAAIGLIEAR